MDTKNILPNSFVDLLKCFIGKEITGYCYEGRFCYRGKLLEVLSDSVIIMGTIGTYTILTENIFSFSPFTENNKHSDISFSNDTTELSKKFGVFLNEEVLVIRENCSMWSGEGRVKHIGANFLAIESRCDNKSIEYIYMNPSYNFWIMPLHSPMGEDENI